MAVMALQQTQLRWDPDRSVVEGKAAKKGTHPPNSLHSGLVNEMVLSPHNPDGNCYGTAFTLVSFVTIF